MKKLLLSLAVIIIFGVYAIYQRFGSDDGNVVAPKSLSNSSANTSTTTSTTTYKDGTYTGSQADAFYGLVQVKAIVSGGKITDVQFLQYPSDRGESIQINSQATPLLKQEAIQAQSANVDIVSGATQTSEAFQQSLQSALQQAS